MPQDYSVHGLCLARGMNDILLDVHKIAWPIQLVWSNKILSIWDTWTKRTYWKKSHQWLRIITHKVYVWFIYLVDWLIFCMVNVGKYTIPNPILGFAYSMVVYHGRNKKITREKTNTRIPQLKGFIRFFCQKNPDEPDPAVVLNHLFWSWHTWSSRDKRWWPHFEQPPAKMLRYMTHLGVQHSSWAMSVLMVPTRKNIRLV